MVAVGTGCNHKNPVNSINLGLKVVVAVVAASTSINLGLKVVVAASTSTNLGFKVVVAVVAASATTKIQ